MARVPMIINSVLKTYTYICIYIYIYMYLFIYIYILHIHCLLLVASCLFTWALLQALHFTALKFMRHGHAMLWFLRVFLKVSSFSAIVHFKRMRADVRMQLIGYEINLFEQCMIRYIYREREREIFPISVEKVRAYEIWQKPGVKS